MKVAHQLQGYQVHTASEFLADRYPYLDDIRGHLKDDEVSMASGERLFPRLVEQLKSPSLAPEKLTEALCTVCDLCSHQESKCQAIAADVVAAATNLLMHESLLVRRDAARVISSLALSIGGRSLMPAGSSNMAKKQLAGAVAAGATLPRLAKLLLGCNDEVVKMRAAEALRSITIFRDGCQQVVDQGTVKGCAQYLCATLPDLPPTQELTRCLLHLLVTLAAVTMYAQDGLQDLLGVGLIPKVIGFLSRVRESGGLQVLGPDEATEVVRQTLRLLWHCGNDPRGRREALKADGVRVVSGFLEDADDKVREAAVCALNVASLETQGKKDVLRHSMSGLAQLLLSRGETRYLHETCVQLCRSASELPAFRFAFARHILPHLWLLEKIYGTCALAAIGQLLAPSEDQETRARAAEVAAQLLRAERAERTEPAEPASASAASASAGDLIRVPPVCPLANVGDRAAFALQECVDLLANLAEILAFARAPALDCLDRLTEATAARAQLRQLLEEGRARIPEAAAAEVAAMLRKV